MWKWTDYESIKLLILDKDSLPSWVIDFDFSTVKEKIIWIFAKKGFKCQIEESSIEYYEFGEMIQTLMHEFHCYQYNIIGITSNVEFIHNLMSFRIGNIYIGEFCNDFMQRTPDFVTNNKERFNEILNGSVTGYSAEVGALGIKSNTKRLLIKIDLKKPIVSSEFKPKLVVGGRYYSKTHGYTQNDPLSVYVRAFKNYKVSFIDEYYDNAIELVNNSVFNTDIVTYAPAKNENMFDRFKSLELNKTKGLGIEVKSLFTSKKEYCQKESNAYERSENVKNAFEIDGVDIKGKNIIILDDVYTTGATMEALMSTLYGKGAKQVVGIVLAINQLNDGLTQCKTIQCQQCKKGVIHLMYSNRYDQLFFGCSAYNSIGCTKTYRYSYENYNIFIRKSLPDIDVKDDLNDSY